MVHDSDKIPCQTEGAQGRSAQREQRDAKRAAALRENLKRRKAQGQERTRKEEPDGTA